MNRTYESNGPDVKIRGTAAHIAEKYSALSREAITSGDRVAAENYLQHAEHYNRIVAAAMAQQAERQAADQERRGRQDGSDEGEDASQEDELGAAAGSADSGAGNEKNSDVVELSASEESDASSQSEGSDGEEEAPAKPRRRSPRRRMSAKTDDGEAGQETAEASSDAA